MEDTFRFSVPVPPEGTEVSIDQAEKLLREQVAEHPETSKERREALWQLMRILVVTDRQEEGFAILDTLLGSTVDPEERAGITLAMGQLLEGMGDFQSAIEAYSRGVALEPVGERTWYFLHNNLGFCLNHFGRYAEAESWCRAAIQIEPLRHNAHKNLGLTFQGQGRYTDAALSFIQAVHREAGDPRALQHLRELVKAHPEVEADIPDLSGQIESCSMAVEAARLVRMRQVSGKRSGPSL